MARILIGTFFQETNDFHPNDTVYEDFHISRGDGMLVDPVGVVDGAVDTLSARGRHGNRAHLQRRHGRGGHDHAGLLRAGLIGTARGRLAAQNRGRRACT